MRERLFSKLIRRFINHPNSIYRNIQLQILLCATAKAYNKRGRQILFSDRALEAYMLFSKECMEGMNPDNAADIEHIYTVAYNLGRRIKRLCALKEPAHLKQLVYLLYQNIGICMQGALPDEFLTDNCYFSDFYSPVECRIMSAMDSGIISGIYEDYISKDRLEFTSRLTDNCEVCRAHWRKHEQEDCNSSR